MAIDKKQIDSTLIANYGSFQAWVTAQSTTPVSIIIACDINLDGATVTLPSTIDIYAFINNSKFTNGSVNIGKMSARPVHQIFDSAVTAVFNFKAIVCPEWWYGSLTGIDATATIQKAINAVYTIGGTVLMYLSTYTVSGSLVNCDTIELIDLTGSLVLHQTTASSFTKGLSAGGFISNGSIKLTPLGGIAVRVINNSGSTLNQGELVSVDGANYKSILLSVIGAVDCFGVVLDASILTGASGWIVINGLCQVYFNASGSTMGDYFRISVADDASATNGFAQSESTAVMDLQRKKGYVLQTRSGAGLALGCLV